MTPTNHRGFSRRTFFETVAGASVAAVLPTSVAQTYQPGNDETKSRYRESEDVKAFYRTNGYEY